jgi:hypothetical protein
MCQQVAGQIDGDRSLAVVSAEPLIASRALVPITRSLETTCLLYLERSYLAEGDPDAESTATTHGHS